MAVTVLPGHRPGVPYEYLDKLALSPAGEAVLSSTKSSTERGALSTSTQEAEMKIIKNELDTMVAGQSDWFVGNVYIDVISTPSATSKVMGGIVHFAPGARRAWHTHPAGQTIYITERVSLVQREGGVIEEVHPGDRVYVEPGENHWHGAAPKRFTVQLAYQEADDAGNHTTWGRPVTDEEYSG
jgi:quercetin dioxygenase-like cupin family protein